MYEHEVPKEKDQWVMVDNKSSEDDKNSLVEVQSKLGQLNYYPQFGTMLTTKNAVRDLIIKLKKILKESSNDDETNDIMKKSPSYKIVENQQNHQLKEKSIDEEAK